ncbi:MAG: hypothetical protein HOC78_03695 [Candidatus Komeilibacteria bacterium]|jgi:hypothetical protein|nr:hypothetical protein [Candidatus Komeilibacteria bacterium]
MLKEILQFNNINTRWGIALILVFFVSGILSLFAWVFYLFYWVFLKINIFAKKSDLRPQI